MFLSWPLIVIKMSWVIVVAMSGRRALRSCLSWRAVFIEVRGFRYTRFILQTAIGIMNITNTQNIAQKAAAMRSPHCVDSIATMLLVGSGIVSIMNIAIQRLVRAIKNVALRAAFVAFPLAVE